MIIPGTAPFMKEMDIGQLKEYVAKESSWFTIARGDTYDMNILNGPDSPYVVKGLVAKEDMKVLQTVPEMTQHYFVYMEWLDSGPLHFGHKSKTGNPILVTYNMKYYSQMK